GYWQKAISLAERNRLSLREELRIKGQYYHDCGDLVAAESLYRRFVANYPNDALPSFLLGAVLADLGREQEGTYYMAQAAQKKPPDFTAHAHLAMLYMDAREFDKARAEVAVIRNLGQREWSIWLEGVSTFLQGGFTEALNRVAVLSDSPDTAWRSR